MSDLDLHGKPKPKYIEYDGAVYELDPDGTWSAHDTQYRLANKHLLDAKDARIAELEAEVARYRPMPVDHVSEDWKDGRDLVVWMNTCGLEPYMANYLNGKWMVDEMGTFNDNTIAYVSLPVPPAQEADRG